MSVVVGIDPSLTRTGLAAVGNGRVISFTNIPTSGKRDATLAERRERLLGIAQRVGTWTACHIPDLVVIENPAYSKTVGSSHDRSGLWWLIIKEVSRQGVPVMSVAPNVRAKYATGSGRADKEAVIAGVNAMWGDLLPSPITCDDEADALVLAALGSHAGFGMPLNLARLSDRNLEVLGGVYVPPLP